MIATSVGQVHRGTELGLQAYLAPLTRRWQPHRLVLFQGPRSDSTPDGKPASGDGAPALADCSAAGYGRGRPSSPVLLEVIAPVVTVIAVFGGCSLARRWGREG